MNEQFLSSDQMSDIRAAVANRTQLSELSEIRRTARRRRVQHRAVGSVAIAAALVVGAAGTTAVANGGGFMPMDNINYGAIPTTELRGPVLRSADATPPPTQDVRGKREAVAATMPAKPNICQAIPASVKNVMLLAKVGKCGAAGPLLLLRTDDGGKEWDAATMPGFNEPVTIGTRVEQISARTAIVGNQLTRDGGDTWSPLGAFGAAYDSVPVGWPVMKTDKFLGEPDSKMATLNPTTGQRHLLLNQPEVGPELMTTTPVNGMIWAVDSGFVRGTTKSRSANTAIVSRDRGRTWERLNVPGAVQNHNLTLSTLDGKTVYALYTSEGDGIMKFAGRGSNSGDMVVHRSTDGGATWTETATLEGNKVSQIQVRPDGKLLLAANFLGEGSAAPLRVSVDGGKTSTPVEGTKPATDVKRTSFGLYLVIDEVATRKANTTRINAISADGIHFVPLPKPAGSRAT